MSLNTTSNLAAYKVLGHESFVTFEAEEASLPGTDNRALAILTTLQSLMQSEEMVLLGGNGDLALGITPTPTLADQLTGGALAPNTAYTVLCVALTLEGFLAASVPGGINLNITRDNADGSTDTYGGGAAQVNAPATLTTANDGNNTHGLKASVTPVNGAVAYAWFWGTTAGQLLGAITTINSVLSPGRGHGDPDHRQPPGHGQQRQRLAVRRPHHSESAPQALAPISTGWPPARRAPAHPHPRRGRGHRRNQQRPGGLLE